MVEGNVVSHGYIKLLALSIGHLETEIIMERNTNSQHDIDTFKEKYGNIKSVIIPDCVVCFGEGVFEDCEKLVKIMAMLIILKVQS